MTDGVIKPNNILKVDSFLNHQIEIDIMRQMAYEFKRRFKGLEVNRILTIEASGIAIATLLGDLYDVPVVFAKKDETANSTDDKYISQAYSFTHKKVNNVFISRPYLKAGEKVLIVDDFIATTHGMGTLIGAVIVGGIAEGLLGLFARYWIKIISPIVAATVVTAIGFSLLPIGANSFAGGQGAADFGAAHNWIVGTVTLLTCLGFQVFARGVLRSLSVLVGLAVGYVLAVFMGMVDFSGLQHVGLISLPQFLPFKPEFDLGAILSIIAIFMVSATETIGDTSALCSGALHRAPTEKELGASISCDGFVSSVAGIFGCTPITSFSQNVGLANLSGVVNRFAIATGACIMILGGIFPAVGTILTTIPQAVLGGCTIIMFGSIMYAGFTMMAKCGFSDRNMIIVALSLSVGIGFTQASEMFSIFPQMVRTIFAENCVAVVFLLAVILNLLLPKEKEA